MMHDSDHMDYIHCMFRFHYMAVSEERQRYMPLPDDRKPGRGMALDYPEAVKLINPIEQEFTGEVLSLSQLFFSPQ